jgi:aspartate kinase
MIRVFKFGGALLKDASGIERMASIVEEFSCERLIIVVSAIGKTTNALENLLSLAINNSDELASEYFKLKSFHINLILSLPIENKDELIQNIELTFRNLWDNLNQDYQNYYFSYDQIVSFGELLSGKIINFRLAQKKLEVKEVSASSIIITNNNYTDASVNWQKTTDKISQIIQPVLDAHKIVVTQGFLGGDDNGNTTTLGREGSDFTAAIIGSILKADEIVIWKDVPGLMNADPNLFDKAIKLNKISYHEAIELAFYGASVIHPKTIQPLQENKLTLQVRSFYDLQSAPSVISDETSQDDAIPKIIIKKNQTLLSISSRYMKFIEEENLYQIFKTFSKHKIHINLMQNSAISFSVSFNKNEKKFLPLIEELSANYYTKYNDGLTLLTLRHYDEQMVTRYTTGKKILLEQKNRTTVQLLYK